MSERRFARVAVLAGGVSSEREVSLRSGAAVAEGLRAGGYAVSEVDVTAREIVLPEDAEAVFVALHGSFGEDGGAQEALERLGVPYTGSGPASCRLSFDKAASRERLEAAGVPVPEGEMLRRAEERTLSLPVVAKPPKEGSSVGCRLVFEEAEWPAAFAEAARFSGEALVERYVPGRELTVGVLEGEALPAVEIVTASTWYDYEAKYVTGDTRYVVPAELPVSVENRLSELALATFDALDARTFGRVDFRLSGEGEPFVLELNAIPGFTTSSLLPKAAEAAGIGFSELCVRIMRRARI